MTAVAINAATMAISNWSCNTKKNQAKKTGKIAATAIRLRVIISPAFAKNTHKSPRQAKITCGTARAHIDPETPGSCRPRPSKPAETNMTAAST